jgi:hypothetical protein
MNIISIATLRVVMCVLLLESVEYEKLLLNDLELAG